MATYTENYNLLITEREDHFNILDYNENFEAIDAALAETSSEMGSISNKIGEADDTDNNTVFGKLNAGGSPIKSIQHVIYTAAQSTTSGNANIEPVNPQKCIVIFERLGDLTSEGCSTVNYALNESSISLTHNPGSGPNLTFGFWIIEFN